MARPIRIEIEGGWYHVLSRGIERRGIFRDDSDRNDFLKRLFGLTDTHGVLVHAYCLMPNHFHLQLRTLQANLKLAMQRLLSGYAVRFNLRHRRAGPLFQGRYRAILAGEEDSWVRQRLSTVDRREWAAQRRRHAAQHPHSVSWRSLPRDVAGNKDGRPLRAAVEICLLGLLAISEFLNIRVDRS